MAHPNEMPQYVIDRIMAKQKANPQKANKEMMDLYKEHKVSPLSGCLPMLLQFPVFLGLYNALRTPIELRHASFMYLLVDDSIGQSS